MPAKRRRKLSLSERGRKGGRAGTKFTPDVQRAIVADIRAGAFPSHAAEANGISRETFRNWVSRGDEARKNRFRPFAQKVRQAQARAQVAIARKIFREHPVVWALYGPGRASGPTREGFRRRDEIAITGAAPPPGPSVFDEPSLRVLIVAVDAELARIESRRARTAPPLLTNGAGAGTDGDLGAGRDPAGADLPAAVGESDVAGELGRDAAPRAAERDAPPGVAP